MIPTTDIAITQTVIAIVAFLICSFTAAALIVFVSPQTKSFWLRVDYFYYFAGLFGLVALALNLGEFYTDFQKNSIREFMRCDFARRLEGPRPPFGKWSFS